jgi:hypothetical protein
LTRELYPVKAPGSFVRILGHELWNVSELRRTFGIVTNDLGAALAGAGTVLDVVCSGFFASYGLSGAHAVDRRMRQRGRLRGAPSTSFHRVRRVGSSSRERSLRSPPLSFSTNRPRRSIYVREATCSQRCGA